LLTQGMVIKDGAKMSKSKGNVVDPDRMIRQYGADTTRLFSLFAAPPEKDLEWSDKGIEGASRFLHRVWRWVDDWQDVLVPAAPHEGPVPEDEQIGAIYRKVHETIWRVTRDIGERQHLNTAVSAIMELVNMLYQVDRGRVMEIPEGARVLRKAAETVLLLLSPFAPHVCDELWERLGREERLLDLSWPSFREEVIQVEQVTVVVQINGKVRSRIQVARDASQDVVTSQAMEDEKVCRFLSGKDPKRVVYVPGRLLNIVV